MTLTEQCKYCKYFIKTNPKKTMGECRYNPPTCHPKTNLGQFPYIRETKVCRCFRWKPEYDPYPKTQWNQKTNLP